VENICAYFQADEPADVYTREEAYLLLADSVTLRWTETDAVTETVEPSTLYQDDSTLDKGKTKVQSSGSEGKVKNTYELTYEDGEVVNKELVAQKVVTESVPKIVLRGTRTSPRQAAPLRRERIPPKRPRLPPKRKRSRIRNGRILAGHDHRQGVDYPNIDTSLSRPGPSEGIMGPDVGSLSFRWPTDRTSVSSYFGWRYGRMHYGVDIFDDRGSPIYAAESGTVTSYTGTHTGYGLIVEISHSNGYTTRYAHLESTIVSAGDKVVKGQIIAYMGDSGTTSSLPTAISRSAATVCPITRCSTCRNPYGVYGNFRNNECGPTVRIAAFLGAPAKTVRGFCGA
jgi:murein DD-endopeptidase MepM/ murein hydrolase activator NlpD